MPETTTNTGRRDVRAQRDMLDQIAQLTAPQARFALARLLTTGRVSADLMSQTIESGSREVKGARQ